MDLLLALESELQKTKECKDSNKYLQKIPLETHYDCRIQCSSVGPQISDTTEFAYYGLLATPTQPGVALNGGRCCHITHHGPPPVNLICCQICVFYMIMFLLGFFFVFFLLSLISAFFFFYQNLFYCSKCVYMISTILLFESALPACLGVVVHSGI